MNYKVSLLACFVLAASFACASEEEVRVLVFPSGTKPSVAAQNPKFEIRKTSGKNDVAMMCDKCMKKVEKEGTKPAVKVSEERCEAYLCSHCGHMVWRDKGKEQSFKEKDEKKAMHTLEAELKMDPTTKPAAASNIGKK